MKGVGMGRGDGIRSTIDRMVEESIRRILPAVMNEVLVATVARGISESVPSPERSPRRKPPKKRRPVREQRRVSVPRKAREELGDLLTGDSTAGTEFYGTQTDGDESGEDPIAKRIESLPPELRGLAEDIDMGDDGGEMWGDGEFDSSPGPVPGEIRNISEAARTAGIDFSRMKAVIGATAPPVSKVDGKDLAARAQFEEARLKRMRERLNGGKPLG